MIKPFTTDGCSGGMTYFWKKLYKKEPPWNDCCVEHDHAYWLGGTRRERLWADTRLLIDVSRNGYPWWAMLMFASVRVGGSPWLPFSWRWAYGHCYGHGYD